MSYTAFIDDSGSQAGLFDIEGNPRKIADYQPFAVLFALIVADHIKSDFARKWEDLRTYIRNDIGCEHLPSIHMRIMFREDHELPHKDGQFENSYLRVSREKRLGYIELALKIIDYYAKRGYIFMECSFTEKIKYVENDRKYYESELFHNEYGYLRKINLKATKKMVSMISNPHLNLLSNTIFILNKMIKKNKRMRQMSIVYDANPDSKGFDARGVIDFAKKQNQLKYIQLIRESRASTDSLIQAADVRCNLAFKNLTMPTGGHPIVAEWSKKYTIMKHGIYDLTPEQHQEATILHFAVIRHLIELEYPEFAQNYIVTAEEFSQRRKQNPGQSTSILK
jgi:hypothetical protein